MDGFLTHYSGMFDEQNLSADEVSGNYVFWISGFDSESYEHLLDEGGFDWAKETYEGHEPVWSFESDQVQDSSFDRYLVEGDDLKITTYLERSCPSSARIEFLDAEPEILSDRDKAVAMFNMEPDTPYSLRNAISAISNGLKSII